MSDDILKLATRAMRETTEPERSSAGETSAAERRTRSRVMASLHQGTVRRRTRLAFLLPIAATLATVSAWGAASGKAPELWDTVTRTLGIESSSEPSSQTPPARLERSSAELRRSAEAAAQPRSAAAPATQVAAQTPAPAATPEPAPSIQAPPAASSAALAVRPKAAPDPSHELYRRAHQAHFTEHDPARALALWESYLREAPRGRFAVEARYNRALCLVRLGRHAEARTALEPFAKGAVGSYRQHDAEQLLEALGD
jgi:hypothetical protein